MQLSFKLLWLWWLAGVVYNIGVNALGFFPERTLATRLSDDAQVAWFILSVWVVVRWFRYCEVRDDAKRRSKRVSV